MSLDPSSEIQATKKDFIHILKGEYLITGFFWVFSTIGSMVLLGKDDYASTLFLTLSVLMLSNGIWEILTGWYADNFKRHVSMYAGFGACLVGFCLMGIAPLFPPSSKVLSEVSSGIISGYRLLVWIAGVSIWSLGPALLSGAIEAWLVDRCKFFSSGQTEDFEDVFKRASAAGTLAKAIGTAVCFTIFYFGIINNNGSHMYDENSRLVLVFGLAAGFSVGLSAWYLYRSYMLQEEYWSHPKYQMSKSLFSFLGESMRDLWKAPYFWFTISFVGATSLNYIVSSTVWPYLVRIQNGNGISEVKYFAIALLLAELIGSGLSAYFSKLIDRVKQPSVRITVASLIYLAPVLPFLFMGLDYNRNAILTLMIFAAFSFRIVHASVFGSLYTIGQQAIESDERRAVLISISSSLSAFVMSAIFLLFFLSSQVKNVAEFELRIGLFWRWVPLPFIILVWGGYLATRPRTEGS